MTLSVLIIGFASLLVSSYLSKKLPRYQIQALACIGTILNLIAHLMWGNAFWTGVFAALSAVFLISAVGEYRQARKTGGAR